MRYIQIIADGQPNKHNAVIVLNGTSADVYADTPKYKKYVENLVGNTRGTDLEKKFERMSYLSTQVGDMNPGVMTLIKAFSMTQPQQQRM